MHDLWYLSVTDFMCKSHKFCSKKLQMQNDENDKHKREYLLIAKLMFLKKWHLLAGISHLEKLPLYNMEIR